MKIRNIAALALAITSALATNGAVVLVTSSAALGENDSTDWSALGVIDSLHASPLNTTTLGGRSFTATTSGGGDFQRYIQDGVDWNGNFAPNTPLLYSGDAPMTFVFAVPIRGAGMRIQPDDNQIGAFTAKIGAFGTGDVLLGTFTSVGYGNQTADGSALFIGAKSDADDIAKIKISFTATQLGTLEFMAISDISISAVPEPATYAMTAAAGLLAFAGWRRRAGCA